MRVATTTLRRWAMAPAALAVMGGVSLMGAGAASAALPAGTVTAAASCYFVNSDGSYTVNLDVTNNDAAPVTIKIGGENKFNPGADNQGQPDTFAPGTTLNAAQATFKATDWAKAEWRLNNVNYRLTTTTVCPVTAVTADGNVLAVLLFGAVVTAGGAALLGTRRGRRFGSDA